jgi:L-fuculose-phosphate aldolase
MSRRVLVDFTRRCVSLGLNHGSTGNLSVRSSSGFLITPTAIPADQLDEGTMVDLAPNGAPRGPGRPSSEWRLHAAIYSARADAHAIVHTHPPFSTTIACLRCDIPPVHYMLAITGGGRVRCSSYATFGSEELSAAALEALGESRACLLANHGLVTIGPDLETAVRIAVEVENVAAYWWRAKAAGEPVLLSEAEMKAAVEQFKNYGTGSP